MPWVKGLKTQDACISVVCGISGLELPEDSRVRLLLRGPWLPRRLLCPPEA